MPLQLASDTILRMLRARRHHHYQGQVGSLHNFLTFFFVELLMSRIIIFGYFLCNLLQITHISRKKMQKENTCLQE